MNWNDPPTPGPASSRDVAQPPRYVPTLTEVITPAGQETPAVVWPAPAPHEPHEVWPFETLEPLPVAAPVPDDEERLLRVLQRVEVLLDRRLSAALSQAAESVSREFAQRLKLEMEPVIREAVSEAVAEEFNPTNHPRE